MENTNIFLSPKRIKGYCVDAENNEESPPLRDPSTLPWNWGLSAHQIAWSPTTPDAPGTFAIGSSPDTPKSFFSPETEKLKRDRGRPRTEMLSALSMEGSMKHHRIRCKVCNRVFPREKSLQAHMRTHTGERPYVCDYPGCTKAFCQSGQLKTHQRLHTGEKPFVCSYPGCKSSFTHANRHCVAHPSSFLKRLDPELTSPEPRPNASPQEINWLERYVKRRRYTPSKGHLSLRTPSTKRSLYRDIENQWKIAGKPKAVEEQKVNQKDPRVACSYQEQIADFAAYPVNTQQQRMSSVFNGPPQSNTGHGLGQLWGNNNTQCGFQSSAGFYKEPMSCEHVDFSHGPSFTELLQSANPCMKDCRQTNMNTTQTVTGLAAPCETPTKENVARDVPLSPSKKPLKKRPVVLSEIQNSPTKLRERDERIMGALALVQLANMPSCPSSPIF